MNDLEKAMTLLESRKFRLKDIHEETGISLNSLSSYSSGRNKLKKAAWETVYKLALCYDKMNNEINSSRK